jgi:hypothetical protein
MEDVVEDNAQDVPVAEEESVEAPQESPEKPIEAPQEDLPVYVKERLGRQEKRHQKQIRGLQDQLQGLQSHILASQQGQAQSEGNGMEPLSEDERIHRAVSMALSHKDQLDRRAKEEERQKHVVKQYHRLQEDLDNAAQKYDDFDEVVRGQDAPYTEAMRDASLLLPNAADVLYKLGKNPNELRRISELHPLEQAREMMKLSIALHSGSSKAQEPHKVLSPIKSSPVSSTGINDKTPISDLRKLLKNDWK